MRRRHYERGASMVEFAIAGSLFLLMMFGIIEFARVLDIYHTVSNAARIGSRWAAVRGSYCSTIGYLDHCNATSSDIETYVRSVVPLPDSTGTTISGCDVTGLCVTSKWTTTTNGSGGCDQASPTGNNSKGHMVCVVVKYPFNFALPFVSNTPLVLTSESDMSVAN
jgi:Flp pilus assembly protein TadG